MPAQLCAIDDVGSRIRAVILTNIVSVIMTHIEVATLSTKTLAALRAELPRPRIVKRMIVAGSTVTGDRESEARNRETMRGMKQMLGGGRPDENNGAWLQGVWQLLQSITFAVQDTGACTRRGCDRRAGKGAGTTCEMCKVTVNTSYCSKVCMQKYDHLSSLYYAFEPPLTSLWFIGMQRNTGRYVDGFMS